MSVVLAVTFVGAGSLLFRLLPLLGARRIPAGLTSAAPWAGLAVLAAMTVRSVLGHQDSTVPAPQAVAALAVSVGLLIALRGRSLLSAVGGGALTYLAIAAALAALS